jgi:hypothetical protein
MVSDFAMQPRKQILLNFFLGHSGRCHHAPAKASSSPPPPDIYPPPPNENMKIRLWSLWKRQSSGSGHLFLYSSGRNQNSEKSGYRSRLVFLKATFQLSVFISNSCIADWKNNLLDDWWGGGGVPSHTPPPLVQPLALIFISSYLTPDNITR